MLIPRAHLFGNPTRAAARMQAERDDAVLVAPVDGVLNVFVSPADAPGDAVAVTRDRGRGVRIYGSTCCTERSGVPPGRQVGMHEAHGLHGLLT